MTKQTKEESLEQINKEREVMTKVIRTSEAAFYKLHENIKKMSIYDKWWLDIALRHIKEGMNAYICAINPPLVWQDDEDVEEKTNTTELQEESV